MDKTTKEACSLCGDLVPASEITPEGMCVDCLVPEARIAEFGGQHSREFEAKRRRVRGGQC